MTSMSRVLSSEVRLNMAPDVLEDLWFAQRGREERIERFQLIRREFAERQAQVVGNRQLGIQRRRKGELVKGIRIDEALARRVQWGQRTDQLGPLGQRRTRQPQLGCQRFN